MGSLRFQLKAAFPRLGDQFEITSYPTDDYNCIAWAAADLDRGWWPNRYRFWPTGVPRKETVEAFAAAYGTVGYTLCADGNLEFAKEKIALYGVSGAPKHMARQLPCGHWTSKLGESWDICHFEADGVAGALYGEVVCYFERDR